MNRPINGFDYLRVITTFFVVILHTAAAYVVLFNSISTSEWMAANIFNGLSRWSVPVFFMLSGAFLLDPKRSNEPLKQFYQKRVMKLLVPLLGWSIIYYLYKATTLDLPISLKDFFIQLYTNEVYYHLWFLYILIGIYMIVPLLRYAVKDLPSHYFLYGAIIWLIATPITKLMNELIGQPMYFEFPLAGYLGYFILGYALRVHVLPKSMTAALYIAGFISIFITIYGTYIGTRNQDGEFYPFFYSNYSPTTAFIAIAIFLAFKTFQKQILPKTMTQISGLTFGVYLVHAMLLDVFSRHVTVFSDVSLFIQIPLTAAIIMLASLCISFIISKIPIVNKLMP